MDSVRHGQWWNSSYVTQENVQVSRRTVSVYYFFTHLCTQHCFWEGALTGTSMYLIMVVTVKCSLPVCIWMYWTHWFLSHEWLFWCCVPYGLTILSHLDVCGWRFCQCCDHRNPLLGKIEVILTRKSFHFLQRLLLQATILVTCGWMIVPPLKLPSLTEYNVFTRSLFLIIPCYENVCLSITEHGVTTSHALDNMLVS